MTDDSIFRLSWLDVVGEIDSTTPNLVIREIASVIGYTSVDRVSFDHEKVITSIIQAPVRVIASPITHQDWRCIARYINPNVECWSNGHRLQDAFQFIRRYSFLDLSLLDPNFTIGLQTPDCPSSVNSLFLYGLCRKHNILTWPEMSYPDLEFGVRSLLISPLVVISTLIQNVRSSDSSNAINACLLYSRHYLKTPKLNPIKPLTSANLDSISFDRGYLIPDQPYLAVGLIANRWQLDFSSSSSPIDEYMKLYLDGIVDPVDPTIAQYYKVNPDLYSLTEEFNPLFSRRYYTDQALSRLAFIFGLNLGPEDDSYTKLCSLESIHTFYHGLRPKIKNTTSPFMYESIQDVQSDDIISFGNSIDGFTFFTYVELSNYLRTNRSFFHPLIKQKLSHYQINRLRYLSQRHNDLRSAIEIIDITNHQVDSRLYNLSRLYIESSPDVRDQVKSVFNLLLDMSMYMRGWIGPPDQLPIEVAPYRPSGEVALNVSALIQQSIEMIYSLPDIWTETISNLPLLQYQDGFVPSTDPDIGETIMDKINIIRAGEDHPSVIGSCIRVSSGWIASSLHCYMKTIGMEEPFSIQKLKFIT